jgi:hypothetical protein
LYDGEGNLQGVAYDRGWTLLVPLLREAFERIDRLERMLGHES